MKEHFLPFNVYHTSYDMLDHGKPSDCTNGGASSKSNTVYVPCPDGHVTDPDPALVFDPEHRGGNYWALTPRVQPIGQCGPMAGGNLAYTCDSRGKGMVYHIHDRFETWAQYESLSK